MKTEFQPPTTRYQGSKWKLLPWLRERFVHMSFETALDAFGGSGSVAYLLKSLGKQVAYNDLLPFNHQIGLALIENSQAQLASHQLEGLFAKLEGVDYGSVIQQHYRDVFYTDGENRLLDVIAQNVPTIACRYQRALAYYVLFQACIIKRPYNSQRCSKPLPREER